VSRHKNISEAVIRCLHEAKWLWPYNPALSIEELTAGPDARSWDMILRLVADKLREIKRSLDGFYREDLSDFVAQYPTEPNPVAGVSGESRHAIAISLARIIWSSVIGAAYPEIPKRGLPGPPPYDDALTDCEDRLAEHWPAVEQALQRIPQWTSLFDMQRFEEQLRDEAVRAERAAAARAANSNIPGGKVTGSGEQGDKKGDKKKLSPRGLSCC
jgi:hypothetical protein